MAVRVPFGCKRLVSEAQRVCLLAQLKAKLLAAVKKGKAMMAERDSARAAAKEAEDKLEAAVKEVEELKTAQEAERAAEEVCPDIRQGDTSHQHRHARTRGAAQAGRIACTQHCARLRKYRQDGVWSLGKGCREEPTKTEICTAFKTHEARDPSHEQFAVSAFKGDDMCTP